MQFYMLLLADCKIQIEKYPDFSFGTQINPIRPGVFKARGSLREEMFFTLHYFLLCFFSKRNKISDRVDDAQKLLEIVFLVAMAIFWTSV